VAKKTPGWVLKSKVIPQKWVSSKKQQILLHFSAGDEERKKEKRWGSVKKPKRQSAHLLCGEIVFA
jgi:hypothetical protein